jgi:phosphate sodium symporter
VAMGSSLADRAWGRETAVYRLTGVITVIGGWFITAGAAFIMSFTIATLNHFGGFVAMLILIGILAAVLINNNKKFNKQQEENVDTLFRQLVRCHDKQQTWQLLIKHVSQTQSELIDFAQKALTGIVNGMMNEDVRSLRQASHAIEDEKGKWKRYRRKEILGMRKIDYMLAVEKNTWFHLGCNNSTQIIYCLKRMLEPVMEHVDNNFNPLPDNYKSELDPLLNDVCNYLERTRGMISSGDFNTADELLVEGNAIKSRISQIRHQQQDRMQREDSNIKVSLLYLNTLQEMQELVSMMRHLLRASKRFQIG